MSVSVPLADVSWWAPIAIIGGALLGAAVGYLLLGVVGAPRRPASADRGGWERTDKTNYPSWNPAAFVLLLAVVGLIIGLAIGLSAD